MTKAKKGKKTPVKTGLEDLEQVDVFYLPKATAPMYRVLREAVAKDILALWQEEFAQVRRISDNPEEGEAIVVYGDGDQEILRYYLNPGNISAAQVARDKGQMATYLDKFRTAYLTEG